MLHIHICSKLNCLGCKFFCNFSSFQNCLEKVNCQKLSKIWFRVDSRVWRFTWANSLLTNQWEHMGNHRDIAHTCWVHFVGRRALRRYLLSCGNPFASSPSFCQSISSVLISLCCIGHSGSFQKEYNLMDWILTHSTHFKCILSLLGFVVLILLNLTLSVNVLITYLTHKLFGGSCKNIKLQKNYFSIDVYTMQYENEIPVWRLIKQGFN